MDSFCWKLITIFIKNISVFTIISVLKVYIMLTNEFVSFEQMGPDKPWAHSDFAPLTTTVAESIHFNVLQSVQYPCIHFKSSCGNVSKTLLISNMDVSNWSPLFRSLAQCCSYLSLTTVLFCFCLNARLTRGYPLQGESWPRGYITFSCSIQLSMKF